MLTFEEDQQFPPAIVNLLFVLGAIPVLVLMFTVGGESEEGMQAGMMALAIGISMFVLFYTLKLNVQVTGEGVQIKTLYVVSRLIRFQDIATAEDIEYRPIRDYGGWGIRRGRNGTAYNMSGNRGVKLELKNGKRVLIGSQRSDELAAAIKTGLGLR